MKPKLPLVDFLVPLWLAQLTLAVPIVVQVGLHDFSDRWWYGASLWLPVVPIAVALLAGAENLKEWFSRAPSITDFAAPVGIGTAVIVVTTPVLCSILSAGENATLRVCNVAPYDISVAVAHKPHRLEWRREGYWPIATGECEEIVRNFLRVSPKFSVHSAKTDELQMWLKGKAVEWDFDNSEEIGWLHGSSIAGRTARDAVGESLDFQPVDWKSGAKLCVERSWFSFAGGPSHSKWPPCTGVQRAPFVEVPLSYPTTTATVWFGQGGQDVTLRLCNVAPYDISTAVHYRPRKSRETTEGWWNLGPGECTTIKRNFQQVEPEYAVHVSARGEIVRWLYGEDQFGSGEVMRCIPDDIFTDNRRRDWPSMLSPAARVALGGLGLFRSRADFFFPRRVGEAECPGDRRRVEFQSVKADVSSDGEVTLVIPAANPGNPEQSLPLSWNLEQDQQDMRELASALVKRKQFLDRWAGRALPYLLGVELVDDSGYVKGVTVASAAEMTPLGIPVPFQAGDIVLQFDGEPVFDLLDVQQALVRFATTKGVSQAYSSLVERSGGVFEVTGVFFFNEELYPISEKERSDAFWFGVADGVTLGAKATTACGFKKFAQFLGDEKQSALSSCRWEMTQYSMRLMQMYPEAFDIGDIAGSFAGLGRGLLRRALRGKVRNRLALNVLAETSEMALTTWNQTPSGIPRSVTLERLRASAPYGVGIGVATTMLGTGR